MKKKIFLLLVILCSSVNALAQDEQNPATGRSAALADMTGIWVAVVSEDWIWRMVTPLIGDFSSIPENEAAREIAMQWRPENDIGNECIGYGAPAIMNEPSRLRISWQDDNTLKMEIDSGMQTRLFHFDENAEMGEPSRQGHTTASWSTGGSAQVRNSLGVRGGFGNKARTMVAHTSNLIPGYLRKNGIPYSDQATVMEYFEVLDLADGYTWLIDTIVVEDPVFLNEPWVVSRNFKKERDDSNWDPQECFVVQE
jgi:hypothetical protein